MCSACGSTALPASIVLQRPLLDDAVLLDVPLTESKALFTFLVPTAVRQVGGRAPSPAIETRV